MQSYHHHWDQTQNDCTDSSEIHAKDHDAIHPTTAPLCTEKRRRVVNNERVKKLRMRGKSVHLHRGYSTRLEDAIHRPCWYLDLTLNNKIAIQNALLFFPSLPSSVPDDDRYKSNRVLYAVRP